MSHRTDQHAMVPPIYRSWLILLTLFTIGLVFLVQPVSHRDFEAVKGFRLSLFPWITAVEVTVANGLDVFSGKPVFPPTDGQRASMLIGLLLTFVIGPTFLLFSWRAAVHHRHPGSQGSFMKGYALTFLLGGVLVSTSAVPSLFLAGRYWVASRSIREVQAEGERRDRMISAIQEIGRDAREFRVLPSSFGGGNGTFNGYALPVRLSTTNEYRCTVSAVSDTAFTVRMESVSSPKIVLDGTTFASGGMRFNQVE